MTTARLTLRRVRDGDLDSVLAIEAAPGQNWYRSGKPPSRAECAADLDSYMTVWADIDLGYWLVIVDEAVVGVAGVRPSTLAGRECWNLYYRFAPSVRGRGYATEAAQESVRVAGLRAPGWPVVALVGPTNGPSQRVAQRIGMIRRPDLDGGGHLVFAHNWPATQPSCRSALASAQETRQTQPRV